MLMNLAIEIIIKILYFMEVMQQIMDELNIWNTNITKQNLILFLMLQLKTGKSLTGELLDTSDKTKKYYIKDVEINFTDI